MRRWPRPAGTRALSRPVAPGGGIAPLAWSVGRPGPARAGSAVHVREPEAFLGAASTVMSGGAGTWAWGARLGLGGAGAITAGGHRALAAALEVARTVADGGAQTLA